MSAERVRLYDYVPNQAPNRYAPEPAQKVNVKPVKKRNALDGKTKRLIVIALVICGLSVGMFTVCGAVASSLAYSNNKLETENEKLANEVQSLKIDIKSASNVGTVEKVAVAELGMVYPTGTQYVKISNNSNTIDNFAATLKAETFK